MTFEALQSVNQIAGLQVPMYLVILALVIVLLGIAAIVFQGLSQAKLTRQNKYRVSLLLELTRSISSVTSISQLLDAMMDTIIKGSSVSGMLIRLPDETTGILKIHASSGISHRYYKENPLELDRNEMTKEALTKGPIIINDVNADGRVRHRELITHQGIRSMLIAPIMNRGDPLGVLSVYANKPYHFSFADVDFIMDVAQQGAVMLEKVMAIETLKTAEKAQMQFIHYLTHELRSPVDSAMSLLRVLQNDFVGELNEQQCEVLSRIEGRLDLLAVLIDDMLELAAIRSFDHNKSLERVELLPALEKIIDRYQHEADMKQIDITCNVGNPTVCVQAAEDGLDKVFSNLIYNAIKFTPDGGNISIIVENKPGRAVIKISDTGIGIPKEDLPHIWDEFFRAKNARILKLQGSGLGLCIVKQIVDNFGGWIEVSSVEGEGTTFTLTLLLCGNDVENLEN